ncbi:type II secretion system protein [Verrucomicrobiaceae bacterium N1E253]|uniref:Type II secretion system protein n=1 Tax=Oceaniferula marina TaxID=2748318 RepID=A0A851G9Z1_9BACT|nr:type II secretion system protein [Oceaniferula marina]NWK54423.1 type II secretion system protein [Oceaniferula marina]
MKTHSYQHTVKPGFTLIELTIAMIVGLMIIMVTLSLFTQQTRAFDILKKQNFMIREAPQINNLLNSIVSRADAIQMYPTTADAISGTNAATTNATVLALKFQGVSVESGTTAISESYGVVAYDTATQVLNYYGNLTTLADLDPSTPSWAVSTQLKNATFSVENGVLRIQLTGPHDGVITYSTTPLQ